MKAWFHRTGILYRPVHPVGWLLLTAALVFVVYGFFDIDSRSHSASDSIRNTIFLAALTALAYTLLAALLQLLSQRK
jgi:hypothetical protein